MAFKVGDVVLAHIAYEDGTGTKPRPVIILKIIPEKNRYVIAECYSDKTHYGGNKGILIRNGTELGNEMGINLDTWITPSLNQSYI